MYSKTAMTQLRYIAKYIQRKNPLAKQNHLITVTEFTNIQHM